MPELFLLPISKASPTTPATPVHILSTMTWLSFTPLHFIDGEAVADGFLSLKIPVRRAWWIAPDLIHPCNLLPSPPLPCYPLSAKQRGGGSKTWTICTWLITYTFHFSHSRPGIFRNACTDTFNPFQLCKQQYRKKKESSSGTVIILFTMHSHDKLTSTLLISHNLIHQLTGERVWCEYDQ